MKTIKVLFLTTSFPLTQKSVSGLFVKRLVDNLPSIVEPMVLTPCGDDSQVCIDQARYKVKCFKYAPRKWRVLAHKPGGIPVALRSNKLNKFLVPLFLVSIFVKCFIEAKNVDVIHANWSICGAIAGIVGKLRSKPVITTLRGEDANKARNNLIFKVILNLSIKYSSLTVCVSKNIAKNLRSASKNHGSNIKFISNGVNQELVQNFYHSRPNTESLLAITTVGSLTENKNTILILEAVNELVIQGSNVTLNIVGDGPCKPILNSFVEKNKLQDRVFLYGSLESADVYELVKNSNIFILSSFREGRPNVILEAMALGTLVIASEIEGVRELIKNRESGLLFNPHKRCELVECLRQVSIDNTLQKTLPKKALDYIVTNKLYWGETANEYAEIYKSILVVN